MKTALLFLSCFFLATSWAQFTLEAEIRPRLEYRHGFKTLYKASDSPALFISQRSRLNAKHVTEALTVYLSLQNIRVWGDVSQLNLADKNGNVIHQAWAELKFSPTGGIRLGRQELVYDDSRILGNVNWVQQARSHDAAVLRWKGINHQLHLGFAYNQEKENLVGNIYTLKGNYKAIQFLWYHKEGKNLSWSGLFLNNGLQYLGTGTKTKNQILYSQTAGINGTFRQNKLSLFGEGYYQFGKDGVNNQLNAALLGLELKYQWEPNFSTLLGYEYISGNDNGAPKNGKNKAFTPFYGTNHKFNGLMDYFYVGNHLNAFAKENGMNQNPWLFLRGTEADTRTFAAVLAVKYKKITPMDFSHSNIISVFNPQGELVHQREGLGVDNEETIEEIKKQLKQID